MSAQVVGFDLRTDLVGVDLAADLAGVQPATIRQWIRRRHLPVAARDHRGRPRLRGIDVLRAEAATRARARRP